jgi:hypothetical protein
MTTAFYTDERTFWHAGGNYAFTMPVGGDVQPLVSGGLPEAPETKRRLKNLMEVSGLLSELEVRSAAPATQQDLMRIHPASYLDEFKRLSDAGGEDCLTCATDNCAVCLGGGEWDCMGLEGQPAAAGQAVGVDRSVLCLDVYDCAIANDCVVNESASNCYCGTATGLGCLTGSANGACLVPEQRGLETDDPEQITLLFGSQDLGGGRANFCLQCLADAGCAPTCSIAPATP